MDHCRTCGWRGDALAEVEHPSNDDCPFPTYACPSCGGEVDSPELDTWAETILRVAAKHATARHAVDKILGVGTEEDAEGGDSIE